MQMPMQRVVRSVVILIEQTQGTVIFSVPQTTKFTVTQPLRTANNTIQQTEMKFPRRHPHGGTLLQVEQHICIDKALEHTWIIK